MKARALEAAQTEFAEAIEYHAQRSAHLGQRFTRALNRALVNVLDNPLMWPHFSPNHRRCKLSKFRYGIVYRIDQDADEIVIVAFMHLARKPDYWMGRE